MKVLAGDIGGTNARLAIVDIDRHGVRFLHQRRFASRDFPGLAPLVGAFLRDVPEVPDRACFGVACHRVNATCTATNLGWTIDLGSFPSEIGIPHTAIVNDLHAIARGVHRMGPDDLVTLQAGEPASGGVIGIIAPGTGLGEGFLTWTGEGYAAHDSVGGHSTFPARSEVEWGLVRSLQPIYGHVSRERVVSGPGLVNVYRYLAANGGAPEQSSVRAEMAAGDPAAVISRHALAGTDALSERALDLFASALGAAAGDLALTVYATGGVYLAGGIAPRILPKLQGASFLRDFHDKGRLSDVTARLPVHVIVNEHVGVIGAADVALEL